jgi:hypothetical protein
MFKSLLTSFGIVIAMPLVGTAQATVHIESSHLQGPRVLQEQTAKTAIRDYLQSWRSFSAALEQNRLDLLDPAFVGTAKDKLTETIQQQAALGISTRYQDRSHDIQIVFYSPEGLSIELTDKVEYDIQLLDHDRVKTTQHVSSEYIIIITPAEVRWRVRVFQAVSR